MCLLSRSPQHSPPSPGLDRESSSVLFHMLLRVWSRSRSCSTPLVNLLYPTLDSRDCRSLLEGYLEWVTEPLILRANCDDLSRGVHDTVTAIAPHTRPPRHGEGTTHTEQYRLVPPLSVLNLESNLIGWMGASVLSTCLTVTCFSLPSSFLSFPFSDSQMEPTRRIVSRWKLCWCQRLRIFRPDHDLKSQTASARLEA